MKKLGCQGAVTTDDPRNLTAHNHGTNATDVELKRFRADLRETAAQNTGAKTSRLIVNGLQTLSAEAIMAMPVPETIRRDVQRHKAKNRPVEPQDVLNIILGHQLVEQTLFPS